MQDACGPCNMHDHTKHMNEWVVMIMQGTYGPFQPNMPVQVPLWLGMMLHRRSKCRIQPPDWMNKDNLTGEHLVSHVAMETCTCMGSAWYSVRNVRQTCSYVTSHLCLLICFPRAIGARTIYIHPHASTCCHTYSSGDMNTDCTSLCRDCGLMFHLSYNTTGQYRAIHWNGMMEAVPSAVHIQHVQMSCKQVCMHAATHHVHTDSDRHHEKHRGLLACCSVPRGH